MVAVIIPTLDDEGPLALTLAALVPAAADGVVRQVVVVDAGSRDATRGIADGTGCDIVENSGGLGERFSTGAEASSRGDWLLFLMPGVVLEPRWEAEVVQFLDRCTRAGRAGERAAVFRFALDDVAQHSRTRRFWAAVAGYLTGIPHPAQGLLISREFYRRLGGHRPLAALEDVDLARRIGRGRIVRLRSTATLATPPPAEAEPAAAARLRRSLSRGLAALRLPTGLLVRLHG